MSFLALIPVFLSFLILAAHFLRAGMVPLVIFCLAAPLLLIVRRAWAARTIQVLLILGALEWLRIIPGLVEIFDAIGKPYTRMVIILSSVALFTVASVAVFRLPPLRRRYFERTSARPQVVAIAGIAATPATTGM